MRETIMPSFNRFPKEGDIIGRILAGYGELELEMCACVAKATNDLDKAIKALFGTRGELRRIKEADKIMKNSYVAAGLATKYKRTMQNMDWCRTVRNQYAHCNWYDTAHEGLCFVDLERVAKLNKKITRVTANRFSITEDLLIKQETYFKYVQRCFWHLAEAHGIADWNTLRGQPMHHGQVSLSGRRIMLDCNACLCS